MQMLLRIQELAAIRQLPQSLGSLSSFRLFSAAQVVTPDPKVQPGQGPPRFYKSVGVRPASDQEGWHVTLNNKDLKTPARYPLLVPTRALALAIAAEWEWQDRRIRPFTMPLMSLAATAIDQPKPRERIIDTMVQYLSTDAICCREEEGTLAARQSQTLDPILRWARQHFQAEFDVTSSIFGSQHNPDATSAVSAYLQGLDHWELAVAENLAGACRSVLMGLATMQGRLTVQEAIDAARLEEAFQIEEWGLVEGGHDIDIADICVRISAPVMFHRLVKQGS